MKSCFGSLEEKRCVSDYKGGFPKIGTPTQLLTWRSPWIFLTWEWVGPLRRAAYVRSESTSFSWSRKSLLFGIPELAPYLCISRNLFLLRKVWKNAHAVEYDGVPYVQSLAAWWNMHEKITLMPLSLAFR